MACNAEDEDEKSKYFEPMTSLQDGGLRDQFMCEICTDIMQEPNLVKRCLHRTCKNCFNMQDEGLYLNNQTRREKKCPMCQEKIGTNRLIIRDKRMKEMIAILLGFQNFSAVSKSSPRAQFRQESELTERLDKYNKLIAAEIN